MKCVLSDRYAVQLLTPSNLLARINGKSMQSNHAVRPPPPPPPLPRLYAGPPRYDGRSFVAHSKAQSFIFVFNGPR